MQRTVGMTLLVLISITTLSGCLVEKKEIKKFSRTTNNLRVYQPGDYITYNVTAVTVTNLSPPTTQTGTMTVQWNSHANLIRPFTGVPVPVIQEVTTLSLNGATDPGTVRYVSQDANGQVTLHAIEAPGLNTHYWLNTLGDATPTTTESFTTFVSPIAFGAIPQIKFYVLEGCEVGASCGSPIGQYVDDQEVVGDSTPVSTNLGEFINPFRISFSGSSNPSPAPLDVTIDIRNVCGSDTTLHGYNSNGTMYVMPSIGMIRMENTCYEPVTQDTVYYTITIRNTNIAFP